MRPTDDNQPGSKSPQIVPHTRSSKDGQNETTLARLERAGPRRSGTASGRAVRLALLGGSGMLVIGLVSALVSLTRDNVESPPVLEASVPETPALATIEPSASEAPATVPGERDDRHITTVDTADPPALVRMHTDQGDRPEPQTPPGPPAIAEPAARQPAPVPNAARPTVAAPLAAKNASIGQKSSPAKRVTLAKPDKAPAKKARAVVPIPKLEPAAIDTDVALLSAILSQSSRHAGERVEQEAAACAEAAAVSRRCADKPVSQRP